MLTFVSSFQSKKRDVAHGAMGRRIDLLCSTTGVSKAVVYAILYVGCCI